MKVLFALPVLLFAITAFAQNNFVYTNDNFFPNTVSAFRVNPDGSLTALRDSPFLTGDNGGGGDVNPGSITNVSIGEKGFLYVANETENTISVFEINPENGHLALIQGSPFTAGPANSNSTITLAASPNARFLFEVDEASTLIRTFAIGKNGALSKSPGSSFDSGAFPEGLKVTANGKFLLVGLKTSNAVGVYNISATGTLSPVRGSPFLTNGAATAVDANCASSRIFVASAGSDLIDAFDMAADGNLAPVAGSPFPTGGSSTVNALTLTPNNRNLLTSDLFDSAVASLRVAPDGALRSIPGSPFPAANWVGAISPTRDGKFVYATLVTIAGIDGWRLAPDGTLTHVPGSPFTTGQAGAANPALTTFPAPVCSSVVMP
jgi:6-phosphogluconolactonase